MQQIILKVERYQRAEPYQLRQSSNRPPRLRPRSRRMCVDVRGGAEPCRERDGGLPEKRGAHRLSPRRARSPHLKAVRITGHDRKRRLRSEDDRTSSVNCNEDQNASDPETNDPVAK